MGLVEALNALDFYKVELFAGILLVIAGGVIFCLTGDITYGGGAVVAGLGLVAAAQSGEAKKVANQNANRLENLNALCFRPNCEDRVTKEMALNSLETTGKDG